MSKLRRVHMDIIDIIREHDVQTIEGIRGLMEPNAPPHIYQRVVYLLAHSFVKQTQDGYVVNEENVEEATAEGIR